MNNILTNIYGTPFLNILASFIIISATLNFSLQYPIKNKILIISLLIPSILATIFLRGTQDGYSIGMIIGLVGSVYCSVSIGTLIKAKRQG